MKRPHMPGDSNANNVPQKKLMTIPLCTDDISRHGFDIHIHAHSPTETDTPNPSCIEAAKAANSHAPHRQRGVAPRSSNHSTAMTKADDHT